MIYTTVEKILGDRSFIWKHEKITTAFGETGKVSFADLVEVVGIVPALAMAKLEPGLAPVWRMAAAQIARLVFKDMSQDSKRAVYAAEEVALEWDRTKLDDAVRMARRIADVTYGVGYWPARAAEATVFSNATAGLYNAASSVESHLAIESELPATEAREFAEQKKIKEVFLRQIRLWNTEPGDEYLSILGYVRGPDAV